MLDPIKGGAFEIHLLEVWGRRGAFTDVATICVGPLSPPNLK
jgi:hypothetical protein